MSVIFVTFNSAKTIGTALESVRRFLPHAQIVVVDNGSSDCTCDIVRQAEAVQLLEGHGNIGFGRGVNLGARAAAGELLLALNPDTTVAQVDRDGLSDIIREPSVGLRGCLVRSGTNDVYLAHTEWGWRRELCWILMLWFLVPRELTVHRPRARRKKPRVWISGAAFMISRTEFLRLGGFDEEFFLYFEDVDLSRRYRQSNAGVGTTEAIVVTHQGQGSWSGQSNEQIQSWQLLSLLQLVAKWHGQEEAERAAKAILRLLAIISGSGRLARWLPLIGSRASRKSCSADLIRAGLSESDDTLPTDSVYTIGRAALVAVTGDCGLNT